MSLVKQLVNLGLNEKEAKIYVALLELGEATAQQLSVKSELNRATTYVVLENLTKRGLIMSLFKKKKTHFAIENPESFLNFFEAEKQRLERKIDLAKGLMEELQNLGKLTTERTKVKFFEGKQGLALIHKDVLKSKAKNYDNIFNINLALELFPLKPDDHRQKIFNKKKVNCRSIVVYNPKEPMPRFPVLQGEERKYLPADKFPFYADMVFYKNKAAMISLKDNLMGVVIDNEVIVNGLKFLFELAWQGAEKYQSLKNCKK
ncbi:MAG TPA: hypothetical protein ENN28_04200 [Candidatus Uhrbacteria bacterium]|nr:hypothetical protein [Candidatus Uhrbacteria bacterium]